MGNKPLAKLRPNQLEWYRQKTDFSDAEIQDWYKCFHKDCPSGELTEDEFKKIYAQFFPAGDSSTFAGHVFKRFAVNGGKKISFAEFLTALSVTAKGTVEDKVNWAFDLYDTDRDGFISRGDMLEIVTSIYKMVGSIMQMPEDESTPEKRTNKIFHTFDINHSGKLSREEFMKGAIEDLSIVRLLNCDTTPMSTAVPIHSSENTPSATTRLRT